LTYCPDLPLPRHQHFCGSTQLLVPNRALWPPQSFEPASQKGRLQILHRSLALAFRYELHARPCRRKIFRAAKAAWAITEEEKPMCATTAKTSRSLSSQGACDQVGDRGDRYQRDGPKYSW
jgi:hypothetical protein